MLKCARLTSQASRRTLKTVPPILNHKLQYTEDRETPVPSRNPGGGVADCECSREGDRQQYLSGAVFDYVHLLGDETHCGEQKKHHYRADEARTCRHCRPEANWTRLQEDVLESGNLSPPETALYHFSAPQVVQVNNSF